MTNYCNVAITRAERAYRHRSQTKIRNPDCRRAFSNCSQLFIELMHPTYKLDIITLLLNDIITY